MNASARSAFAAAALVAFSGSAHAADRHTWWSVRADDATCELSSFTPEQFVHYANSPEGHAVGMSAERISPDDVDKNPATGDIRVMVHGKLNGEEKAAYFFTSKEDCDRFIKYSGKKPEQAPHDEIN
jgi:hypothetical protein